MDYYGICPASCGELIQGKDEQREFLTSYCIPLYSKAMIRQGNGVRTSVFYKKAYEALKKLFQYYGEEKQLDRIQINLSGNIPRGKGMSSSTADIGAVIGAGLSYLNLPVDEQWVSKLAASIEATDSIFYHDITLIDPLSGFSIHPLGRIERMKVIILEASFQIDTESMRQRLDYNQYKNSKIFFYKKILEELEAGIRDKDPKKIGKAAIQSAHLNQTLLVKPKMEDILKVADQLGAYGVNIAHSGSAVAVMIDEEDHPQRYYEQLIRNKISEVYGRMYCLPIINGGIKKWREK